MPRTDAIVAICATISCAFGMAHADSRLLATNGVTQIEGAAGGGLTPWALIAGLDARGELGGSAYCTRVEPRDFALHSCGLGFGYSDRVELSFARQTFDLGVVAPDRSLRLDTAGIKVRVIGDAIFDPNPWLPQISVGAQYKHSRDYDWLPSLLGAEHGDGVDVYVAATKIFLDGIAGRTTLINATARATQANQLGLLGFGGDRDAYSLQPEFSAAVFVTDSLAVGAEYRFKPDNLSAFEESDFADMFVAWFPHKSISLTLAHVDLGTIAGRDKQRGWYVSLQASW
jgi:hypothetical protein